MMIDVRVRVKQATEDKGTEAQIPWTNSCLLGKFWFIPEKVPVENVTQVLADEAHRTESQDVQTSSVDHRPERVAAVHPDATILEGREQLLGLWELQSSTLLAWFTEYHADGTYTFTNP